MNRMYGVIVSIMLIHSIQLTSNTSNQQQVRQEQKASRQAQLAQSKQNREQEKAARKQERTKQKHGRETIIQNLLTDSLQEDDQKEYVLTVHEKNDNKGNKHVTRSLIITSKHK